MISILNKYFYVKKKLFILGKKLNMGGFFKNVGVLTLGTFGSQALIIIFYPILTRLYTPAEFGIISVVYMITTLLAIFASGAAEGAIIISISRRTAAHVIGWVIIRSAKILFISFILTLILINLNIEHFIQPEIKYWLPLIPIFAAFTIVFSCFSEWTLREQQFSKLAHFRIMQSFLVSLLRTVFGILTISINGLIAGEFIGKILTTAIASHSMIVNNLKYFRVLSIKRIINERERYNNFPRYMMPDQLINTAGGTIHIPFIAIMFGSAELGYIAMSMSILYLPVTVVSSAIKDVFRQRAAIELQSNGSCRSLYLKLMCPVIVIGLLGFSFIYYFSDWIFTFILGTSWAPVGEYTRILIPLYFFNFVSMSMGGVLVVAQRLGVSLAWQIANLIMTVLALTIGGIYFQSIHATLLGLMIAKSTSYLLHMVLSYHYTNIRVNL
uniref:oligosaccharide flippase family protein n=1 Tax=Limnohabitans sp. TaxID=1907725 RepID=UPI0040481C94